MLCTRKLAVILCLGLVAWGCGPSSQKERSSTYDSIRSLVFCGPSLSKLYGLKDPKLSFLHLLQEEINTQHLPYHVQDAGIGLEDKYLAIERIEDFLASPVEIMLIFYGLPGKQYAIEEDRANIQHMIDLTQSKYPFGAVALVDGSQLGLPHELAQKAKVMLTDLAINNQTALISIQSPVTLPKGVEVDEFFSGEEIHQFFKQQLWEGIQPLL